MKSMHRPNSGSRRTPKHHMRPGKNVSLPEVSVVSEQIHSISLLQNGPFLLIMKSHTDELFTVELTSMTTGQEVVSKPQGKAELRRQYLLEKYVWKWKQFMRSRKGEGLFPRLLKLSHNNWLRQVKNIFKIVFHSKYKWVSPSCP